MRRSFQGSVEVVAGSNGVAERADAKWAVRAALPKPEITAVVDTRGTLSPHALAVTGTVVVAALTAAQLTTIQTAGIETEVLASKRRPVRKLQAIEYQ